MQKMDFKKFVHEHFFEKYENGILTTDKLLPEARNGSQENLPQDFFLKKFTRNMVFPGMQTLMHMPNQASREKY